MKRALSSDGAEFGPSPKQRFVAHARRLGVLSAVETARFALAALRAAPENMRFLRDYPDFTPPPLWWMHDMYAHASYANYMRSGESTAEAVVRWVDAQAPSPSPRVADWGCGLGRVIRHMPAHYKLTGFDANEQAIDWCRRVLGNAEFRVNGPRPPLPAADGAFDALYALSVFTHLSETAHFDWIAEIERVLTRRGIFLGAFHTTPGPRQLLTEERVRFEAGALVLRGSVREGSRIYTAFHPEAFLRDRLLARFDLISGPTPFYGQSLYVMRKR